MQREERLKEAVRLINPFGRKSEASIEELIADLKIFDSGGANIILNYPDKEEAKRFIDKTVDVILDYSQKMPAHQLIWAKNVNKMFEEIREEFPEICRLIDGRKRQEEFVNNFKKRIKNIEREIKDPVSAVALKELLDKAREKTKNAFDFENIKQNVLKDNVTDKDLIEEIKQELNEAKERTLSYIEVMEKTPPVKLYYYKTGNRISCKVNINSNGYRYTVGKKKSSK